MDPIKPMLAELSQSPADGKFPYPFGRDGWTYELKWDGNRLVAWARPGRIPLLWSRSGRVITSEYPEIAEALMHVPREVVLDGEVVMLRDGKVALQALANRRKATKAERAKNLRYAVFDAPYENGMPSTLRLGQSGDEEGTRRAAVRYYVDLIGPPLMEGPVYTDGQLAWERVTQERLEGLIAKPAASLYKFGERGTWLKLKLNQQERFVIVGYTAGDGARAGTVGALVLAKRENGKLVYAGKCGTGFNWKSLQELDERFRTLEALHGPWGARELLAVKRHIGPKQVTWVDPVLEATVEFSEYSDAGIPRFPSFKGLA
jgi:bifunctional non-homologous end joining protein LigD